MCKSNNVLKIWFMIVFSASLDVFLFFDAGLQIQVGGINTGTVFGKVLFR